MCASELNIDSVSLDLEYFGLGEIGDSQGIVDRWSVDEIEGLFVRVSEKEQDS